MATPFTVFRKYTGVLMAFLCVLLMISFIVADALPSWTQGGGGGASGGGKVVAKWRGGSITELQLTDALVHRGVLETFQNRLIGLGFQSAQSAGVEDLPLRVLPLSLPTTREGGVERDVVRTKIFAQRAREAGMMVSDETVSEFLQALGRDRVSIEQMRTLIGGMQMQKGRRATTAFLFDLVREALLERSYVDSHRYLFNTVLPAEQWDDWLKVNGRIELEAAPIEAADFVSEVADPTEEQLTEFFALYQDREPSPDFLRDYGGIELPSPAPGFSTPERVRIEYVVAKFSDYVAKAEPEVTEEEIAEFYEQNKERFISADATLFGDDSVFEDETDDVEASDAASTDQTDSDETAADKEAASTEEEEEEEEEEPSDDTDAAKDTNVYQSLDEVRDEIRTVIAQAQASEAIGKLMEELRIELNDEYNKYFDAVLDAEDAKQKPPTAPESLTNLDGVAERLGLERGSLAPASLLELRETTLGKAINVSQAAGQGIPLWAMAFREGIMDRYEPAIAFDPAERNRILFLITERLPRKTPTLDEVRDEVVAAWKRQQAADLALKRAEEVAAKAEKAGQTLTEYFADDDTVTPFRTEPISFLTIGSVSRETGEVRLQLSQPESLVAAGPELLQAAFDLPAGKVGAALNHDRTIAYVLRVAANIGSPEELRSEFLRDGVAWYGAPSTRTARRVRAELTLFENLLSDADLEWFRDTDRQ
ncbi:hypothetical protein [Botrimarina hoheduenensis]|uniref:Periplasmic folding chaperone n=1 Tax=Botrimarina hoheduenensis TaxID=2528000 RepID=A0A5C5WDB7_9BACT|nr:hypothetical protein [Botrimarina hoheduenensis]TWT48664.1 hypothetical protein Pla111_04390 [Botrimarina hoheduenensis]